MSSGHNIPAPWLAVLPGLLSPVPGLIGAVEVAAALEQEPEVDRCICAAESIGLPVRCLAAYEVASVVEDVPQVEHRNGMAERRRTGVCSLGVGDLALLAVEGRTLE